MKQIKDLAKKPSDLLKAMVLGLEENSEKEESKKVNIDMRMWLVRRRNAIDNKYRCFGCAATVTLLKLTGADLFADPKGVTQRTITNRPSSNERANMYQVEPDDLGRAEGALEQARLGFVSDLFNYYGVFNYPSPKEKWIIRNNFKSLRKLKNYIKVLEEQGL